MKKIQKIAALYFHPIPAAEFYAFFAMHFIPMLNAASPAVAAAVAERRHALRAAFAKLEALMFWRRGSKYTEQIAEANHKIDRALINLNSLVRIALHDDDAEAEKAAYCLHLMLKQQGNVTRKPYNSEAGCVVAILSHLEGDMAAEAKAIGAAAQVAKLRASYDTFTELLRIREAQNACRPHYTFREARREMEAAYHPIVSLINSNAMVDTSPEFGRFITAINPTIEHLNASYHRARKNIGVASACAVDSIPTQPYTGKPIIVLPVAHYRQKGKPAIELIFARDFTVTYRHNTSTGTAYVFLHGKGKYTGKKMVTFSITKAEI